MQGPRPVVDHLRQLELVVRNTTNLVVVTNASREIEWVNPAYTSVTGWTLEEVKGKNPKTFLHGPRTSQRDALRLGNRLRRGQAVIDFEMLNYKKSGEPYWVSLNIQPVTNARGEITQYVAIESDITERKRAELESARMLNQLAEAQRLAKLGLMEHELATGAVRCSPELLRILELEADMAPATLDALMRHLHPEDAARARSAYEAAVNDGERYDTEVRLLTRSGRQKWVHLRGVLEGWDDGRSAFFRTVFQDITERKDAERLQQEKHLLEQAQRTQVEVLSRISHELRTPLHAVLGFAEALERAEGARLSARASGYLSNITVSARHLLVLVNDILDLTRLHGGSLLFDIQPVNLPALAQEVASMLQPLAQGRGVSLQVESSGTLVAAHADRQRLRQVLINLVHNGIKYNHPQGEVHVRVAALSAERAAVYVSDTGIGIAEADQARLFEPFYRVPGTAQQAVRDSSGLGLAIARSLARGMGGDITLKSRAGEGSTFTLTLRRAPLAEVQAPERAVAEAPQPTARGTVLYVEDNELNALLVEAHLAERPQVRLHCCATAGEGLARARELRPDLILADMGLPDMTGIALMQAVLDDPMLCRTPCIAFSADSSDAAIEDAIRAGYREYWVKPMARADLLAALDRILGGAQAAETSVSTGACAPGAP